MGLSGQVPLGSIPTIKKIKNRNKKKKSPKLKPVIPATWEAEARGLQVGGQPQ